MWMWNSVDWAIILTIKSHNYLGKGFSKWFPFENTRLMVDQSFNKSNRMSTDTFQKPKWCPIWHRQRAIQTLWLYGKGVFSELFCFNFSFRDRNTFDAFWSSYCCYCLLTLCKHTHFSHYHSCFQFCFFETGITVTIVFPIPSDDKNCISDDVNRLKLLFTFIWMFKSIQLFKF